jgi:hypothetical protein
VADDAAATAVAPAAAGPGSGRGDRPELLVQISMVAVIVAVVAGAVVFSWFNRRLAIPDPTTWEPGRLVTATFDPPTNKVELFHNQGDGQFYVHMAQDPFLRQPERIQGGPSEQAYRLQRPLYGWVGWALTLGDAGRAAWVMVGLTVASVAALAAVVAALAARLGRSPMWGLAILGFPGIHVDLLRCGPEALGTALLGLALLALAPAWRVGPWGVDRHRLSSRRLVASLLCFALAGLTRESFLAVPVVLSAVWWWQTRARRSVSAGGWFRSWGWPLVSVVPFLVWVVVLRLALGAWSQGPVAARLAGGGWPRCRSGAGRCALGLARRRGAVAAVDRGAGVARGGAQPEPGVAVADRRARRVVGHVRVRGLVHVGRVLAGAATALAGRVARRARPPGRVAGPRPGRARPPGVHRRG